MNNKLKIFIFYYCFLLSASLYSAEPLLKLYNIDGSTKEYKLNEIDSLSVIDKKNNYVLRIHYDDSLVAYYPTEIIGSIKFEKDSVKNDILNVYIFSYPKSYKLSSIDSLVFYIDQWQPLTIGSQVWMLKNLNVDHYRNGDSIPEVRYSTEWENLKTGAWCHYNNSDSLGKIYGKLYNWYAVDDPRELAPDGWHAASKEEWETLESYLGGIYVAGGKLKSTGTKEAGDGTWLGPNEGATNESGFSALPGGCRHNDIGRFYSVGNNGSWWSSSEWDSTYAWFRDMYYDYAVISGGGSGKGKGFSVRCVKDK